MRLDLDLLGKMVGKTIFVSLGNFWTKLCHRSMEVFCYQFGKDLITRCYWVRLLYLFLDFVTNFVDSFSSYLVVFGNDFAVFVVNLVVLVRNLVVFVVNFVVFVGNLVVFVVNLVVFVVNLVVFVANLILLNKSITFCRSALFPYLSPLWWHDTCVTLNFLEKMNF